MKLRRKVKLFNVSCSLKHNVVVNQIAKAHELDEIDQGSEVKLSVEEDGKIKLHAKKKDKPRGIKDLFSWK